MSQPRGRGPRGARGSGGPARGASTTRGGGAAFRGNAQRGNSAAPTRGTFTRGRGDAARGRGRGAPAAAKTNGLAGGQETVATTQQAKGKWEQRYDALTTSRARERTRAIQQGLMADPDKPRSLAEAITPVGTCQGMCAEFERVQRVVQNDVWKEELLNPNATVERNGKPEPNEAHMVKKFRRAAAGLEEQLPSDLRPPAVLKRTCEYLFDEVIGNAPALERVHHFVWDRTRAVRNDFSIQAVTRPADLRTAVECYERIARFHILSLHQLAVYPKPYDQYSAPQEREQLDRTLLSLMQLYDDSRGKVQLENEAEFRAYCVIFQLQDPVPDMEDRAQSWPRHIIKDRRVRAALGLYAAACNTADTQGPFKPLVNHILAQQDSATFWKILDSPRVSYLMACVAEIYFNLVRRTTLNAVFKASQKRKDTALTDWTVETLLDLFKFDEEDQVYTFCEAYGFSFATRAEDGEQYINLSSVTSRDIPEPSADLPKQWRSQIVEDKRFGRTLPAVIAGMSVRQAQMAGLVEAEEEMVDVGEEAGLASRGNGKGPFVEESEGEEDEGGSSLFVPKGFGGAVKPADGVKSGFGQPSAANGFTTAGPAASSSLDAGSAFGKPSGTFGQPSASAVGQSSTGTFGQPSANAFGQPSPGTFGQPSSGTAFGQPSANAFGQSPGTSFGKPSAPVSDQGSTPTQSIFAKPAETAKTTETVSSYLFSFGSTSSAPPPASMTEASQPAATFAPPKFDPSTTFSFKTAASQPASSHASTSVFSQPPPAASATSPTPFSSAPAPGITDLFSGSNYKAPSVAPAPPSPEKSPTFGSQTSEAGATSPPSRPEVKAHFTPTNTDSQPPTSPKATLPATTPTISAERQTSLNKSYKPPKPSPLANTSTLEDVASTTSAETIFQRLADEVFNIAGSGFLDQFIEFTVQQAITRAQEEVHAEIVNAQADDFRRQVLLHRYGRRWREKLWRSRSAAKASQRRERARRGLEQARSRGTSVASERRTSVAGPGRSSKEEVDRMFQRTVRGGARPAVPSSEQQAGAGSKRPLESQFTNPDAQRVNGHKRQKSTSYTAEHARDKTPAPAEGSKEDLLRRSSFLGFSSAGAGAYKKSTTQTNYFRLKAMGVTPSTDFTEARGTKRRRSESVEPARSELAEATPPPSLTRSAWQPKAPTGMPPPRSTPSKEDSDEALYARLRAAKEGLAQQTSMFQSGIAREEELQRSLSASASSNESPSMARARAEARWRASQKASTFGASAAAEQEGPAYRFRESRFMPRENYGRAVERANEMRASRMWSRESSRPESRLEGSVEGALASAASLSPETQQVQGQTQSSETLTQDSQAASKLQNGSRSGLESIPKWSPPPPPPPPPVLESSGLSGFASMSAQHSAWSFGDTDTGSQPTQTRKLPFTASGRPVAYGKGSESPERSKDGISPQPGHDDDDDVFGAFTQETKIQDSGTQDFSIEPAQVEQSLARSFGATQPPPPPPRQQDSLGQSQSASEVISLLSDDEDDGPNQPYSSQYAQRPDTNGTPADTTEEDELFDEGGEEVPDSYQHTQPNPYGDINSTFAPLSTQHTEYVEPDNYTNANLFAKGSFASQPNQASRYASNPYAVLADPHGGDTEEDVDDDVAQGYETGEGSYDQDEEAQIPAAPNGFDSGEESYDEDDEVTHIPPPPNGYHREQGYEDEEDEDGDVEDAEDHSDDEDGSMFGEEHGTQNGAAPGSQHYHGLDDGGLEDGEYEEEEESTANFVDPNLSRWHKEPSVNPALQIAGHREDEPIELSD